MLKDDLNLIISKISKIANSDRIQHPLTYCMMIQEAIDNPDNQPIDQETLGRLNALKRRIYTHAQNNAIKQEVYYIQELQQIVKNLWFLKFFKEPFNKLDQILIDLLRGS